MLRWPFRIRSISRDGVDLRIPSLQPIGRVHAHQIIGPEQEELGWQARDVGFRGCEGLVDGFALGGDGRGLDDEDVGAVEGFLVVDAARDTGDLGFVDRVVGSGQDVVDVGCAVEGDRADVGVVVG